MKKIIVIDGLGGGIGVALVARLKELKDSGGALEIIALGSNSTATERMVKAGAGRGATGENAIRVSARTADLILGPIGIIIPDSMMGEISPAMAQAVLSAPAMRILLPLQNEHIILAGFDGIPLARMIERAIEIVREKLE